MSIIDDIGFGFMRDIFDSEATPTPHQLFKPMTAAPTTESQPAPAVSVDGQIYMLESVIEAYNQQLEELRANGFSEEVMQRISETIAANLTSSDSFHRTMSRYLRGSLTELATDTGYLETYADNIMRLIEVPLTRKVYEAVERYLAPRLDSILQENDYLEHHATGAVRRYVEQRLDSDSTTTYLYRAINSMINQTLDARDNNR